MPTDQDNQLAIRSRIDRWLHAFRSKELAGVMSLYAPDIVSFDLVPPLRYEGAEAYRHPWEVTFIGPDPIGYEIHDLRIVSRDSMAFVYSLNCMIELDESGNEKTRVWLRWTACLEQREGEWLVTHEHVSVPVDFASGKAAFDLEP